MTPRVVSTPCRQAAFLENPARPNALSSLFFALWPLGEAGSARERGIWEPGPHNPHTPDATPRDADLVELARLSPPDPILLQGHAAHLCAKCSFLRAPAWVWPPSPFS